MQLIARMKPIRLIAACVLGFGMSACTGLTPLEPTTYSLRLGTLWTYPPLPVTSPDTVAINADFDVSFETTGGGCTKVGTTTVTMADSRTAELRGYDNFIVSSAVCTADLRSLTHHATLRFGQTGAATLHVIGASGDSTITITKTVVVR